jgi:hypothetical protein
MSDCVSELNKPARASANNTTATDACKQMKAKADSCNCSFSKILQRVLDGIDLQGQFFPNNLPGCAQAAGCSSSVPLPVELGLLGDLRYLGACSAPRLGISSDASQYTVGSSIAICYSLPGPGGITITDLQGSSSNVLLSGQDDGTGDCVGGTVSPPVGRECARIDYTGSSGSTSAQACWTVSAGGAGTTSTSGGTTSASDPYYVLSLDGYGKAIFVGRKSDVHAGTVLYCGACTTVPKILGVLAGPFDTYDQAARDYCAHISNPHGGGLGVDRIDAYGQKDFDSDVSGLPDCSQYR